MKWKSKEYLKDREGEERVVSKFLLFPRRLGGKEWRWMERANILERVTKYDDGGHDTWGDYAWRWVEVVFVNTEDKSTV